jgi:hypothetical protein
MVDPRERAARLLAEVKPHVWDGASLPVPVEAIADSHLGLLVVEVPVGRLNDVPGAPSDGDLSGLLLVSEGQIWVNAWEAERWPGRRRFTIGHEIGHWEMHRSRGSMFCRSVEHPVIDIEEEASLFGAGLMFPPHLVSERHRRLSGDVGTMCEEFGASRIAMERAICFNLRLPLLSGLTVVEMFHLDDEGYSAWRAAHGEDGFVLNDDLGDGSGGRLHRAGCSYLDRAVKEGDPPRTRQPKWCSADPVALRELLPLARSCPRCLKPRRAAGRA